MVQEKNKSDNILENSKPVPKNPWTETAWGCGGCLFMIIYAAITMYLIGQVNPLGFILLGLAMFAFVSICYMARDMFEYTRKNKIDFSDDEKKSSDE